MILETLQKEMIAAMKAKNKVRKDTISSIVSAVKKAAIDNKCKDNITEELVNTVILKEQKTMQEMIDTCPADRTDLLTEYKEKMTIITEFAPKLLIDPDEIKTFIEETGIELIKANRGQIMKALKGKADMKIANGVVGGMLVLWNIQ